MRTILASLILTPSLLIGGQGWSADPPAVTKKAESKLAAPKPLPTPVFKGEPEIIGAESFDYLAEFKVRNVPVGTAVIWDIFPDDAKTVARIIKTEKACLIAGPPREYTIKVRLVKGEDVSEFKKTFVLTHAGVKPCTEPIPTPTPPTPTPPTPPTPVTPPAPIPEPGFRVLMVYQDSVFNTYSGNQRAVLSGEEVRNYLDTKAAVGPDGTTREYRIWDADIKGIENESKLWQAAFARPHPLTARLTDPTNGTSKDVNVVWMIVSNGKEGWEGPILPTTPISEVMTILKKYGG